MASTFQARTVSNFVAIAFNDIFTDSLILLNQLHNNLRYASKEITNLRLVNNMPMNRIYDLVVEGGPVMWPLLGLSVATVACAIERGWFWFQFLRQEDRIAHDVLAAARVDLDKAAAIATQAQTFPIGRYLLAPLKLKQPSPETFRLALEAAGDREFIKMRKGDKLLETVVGIAPLLGLLGTVTGLIKTFGNLNIGGGGASDGATKAASGIGEALIATATGMIIAIIALAVFRIFVTFQSQQVDYFSEVGSELELIYRHDWYEPAISDKASIRNQELADY